MGAVCIRLLCLLSLHSACLRARSDQRSRIPADSVRTEFAVPSLLQSHHGDNHQARGNSKGLGQNKDRNTESRQRLGDKNEAKQPATHWLSPPLLLCVFLFAVHPRQHRGSDSRREGYSDSRRDVFDLLQDVSASKGAAHAPLSRLQNMRQPNGSPSVHTTRNRSRDKQEVWLICLDSDCCGV